MLALLCGLWLAAVPAAAAELVAPFSAAAGDQPPPPWHVSGLPRQSKPFTRFTIEDWAGVHALRVEADRSYGNLVHALAPAGSPHHLAWRWALDEPNPEADLRERRLEDMPVRVCVLFDLPLASIPFYDRTVLRLTRSHSSEPVPGASVCYVWDQKLAVGDTLHSPFTGRIRYMVLRSHEAPLHHWLHEQRDVAADFKTLFGEESDSVPPIIGVAVGGDADNTQRHSVAHVGDVTLAP
jgi:hypothetical protein